MTEEEPDDIIEVDQNAEVDAEAQRILLASLPKGWVVNSLNDKDVGKDYLLEVTIPVKRGSSGPKKGRKRSASKNTRKVSGKIIFIQLKGQKSGSYLQDGKVIVQKMKRKHLKHYADDCSLPVFLVVVDSEKETAHWLFMQQYLSHQRGWRETKSTNVHVPTDNTLCRLNANLFEQAITDAETRMRFLRSPGPQLLVADIVQRLKEKDPRIEVIPAVDANSESYLFRPKEDVPISIHFIKDDPDVAKARRSHLIERGLPINFQPGELEVRGTPILDDFLATGGTIQLFTAQEATISLKCLNSDGEEVACFDRIQGVIEGGIKERRFRSTLAALPFVVNIGPIPGPGLVNLTTTLDQWKGKPILQASYFDQTFRFFVSLLKHPCFSFECEIEGNPFLKATVRLDNINVQAPFVAVLEFLGRSRKVAKKLRLNPTFNPQKLATGDLARADLAHDLLFHGVFRRRLPEGILTSPTLRADAKCVYDTCMKKTEALFQVVTDIEHITGDFLGHELNLGPVEDFYANLRIVNLADIERALKETNDEFIEIVAECTPDTFQVIRSIPPIDALERFKNSNVANKALVGGQRAILP